MASKVLRGPLRTLTAPRPAIQAWRSARCFATEVATPSTLTTPAPAPAPPAPVPAGLAETTVPAIKDEELHTTALEHVTKSDSPPVGVVVSAGKMQRTVKVRLPGQKWNKYLRKHFKDHSDHLVHDPNSSLNIGDVVSLHPFRASKHVHHVVSEILVPFGAPVTDRPPVLTEEERRAQYQQKRSAKTKRRSLRRAAAQGSEEAIEKLKALEINPGQGVAAGVGEKNAKKAGLVGNHGQKLQPGVLPGGKHAVGKIDARAKSNKEKAMKRNEQAEANLLEAKELKDEAASS